MNQDLPALVPVSVTVRFPWSCRDYVTYEVPLTALALVDFPGITGWGGRKVLHSSATAHVLTDTGNFVVSNESELRALARQLATDWYRWRFGRFDLAFSGIAPWTPEGLTDCIEWVHTSEQISTRLWRAPWLEHDEEVFHHGTYRSSPPCGFWARITGVDTADPPGYSFVESHDPGDGFADLSGGIAGIHAAGCVDPLATVPVDTLVWMERNGNSGPTGALWDFAPPGADSSFWALVTSIGAAPDYGFVEAADQDGSGPVAVTDPISGQFHEVNNCVTLTVGSICRVWRNGAPDTAAVKYDGEYDPLRVELDGGGGVDAVHKEQFHTPTFLVDSPGPHTARVKLDFGTDIQTCGPANLPGNSNKAPHSNHVHRVKFPDGPPPPDHPPDVGDQWIDFTSGDCPLILHVYTLNGWQCYCLPCCDCPSSYSSYSSYSSSSGSTSLPNIQTPCCPNTIKRTLHWTLHMGSCPENDGLAGTLNYIGGVDTRDLWNSGAVSLESGNTQEFTLHCEHDNNTWYMDSPTTACWAPNWTLLEFDCGPPLTMTWGNLVVDEPGCPSCISGQSITLTIVEAP